MYSTASGLKWKGQSGLKLSNFPHIELAADMILNTGCVVGFDGLQSRVFIVVRRRYPRHGASPGCDLSPLSEHNPGHVSSFSPAVKANAEPTLHHEFTEELIYHSQSPRIINNYASE